MGAVAGNARCVPRPPVGSDEDGAAQPCVEVERFARKEFHRNRGFQVLHLPNRVLSPVTLGIAQHRVGRSLKRELSDDDAFALMTDILWLATFVRSCELICLNSNK